MDANRNSWEQKKSEWRFSAIKVKFSGRCSEGNRPLLSHVAKSGNLGEPHLGLAMNL